MNIYYFKTFLKHFFLTLNEWLFYLANRKNFRLYFVSEINSTNPIVHRIEDLLKDMEEGKLAARQVGLAMKM